MSGAQVIISGFGGQGVILAGQILGRAVSVHEGRNAVMAQSYGPESRGGACKTEVILSDGTIEYPRVVEPDVVVEYVANDKDPKADNQLDKAIETLDGVMTAGK